MFTMNAAAVPKIAAPAPPGIVGSMAEEKKPALGLSTGVGLVIANMIGVGVLTSNGYMASSLAPRWIFLVWVIQGVLAIAGARAYAAIAQIIPRSGGEYRYLSDLLHPALGYLAGWTSLLVGFAAPVAANAFAAGGFARTLAPGLDARLVGGAIIVVVTLLQALNVKTARWSQDLLAWVKVALFAGFIVLGLTLGRGSVPAAPAQTGFPAEIFAINLFYAAYAYSGWNATIYAAEEFRDPRRDVARAMVIGAALVTVAYLAISFVFVANLSPGDMGQWKESEMTVAHLIARKLVGEGAAAVVSIGVILVLVSCISAMTLIGPRVNATMARDGFLPRALAGREGRPPVISVVLQGALALALLYTHSFASLMQNVGVILTLVSALTVFALFRVRFSSLPYAKPGLVPLAAAALYVAASAWMLYYAFKMSGSNVKWWVLGTAAVSTVAYGATRRVAGRRAPAPSRPGCRPSRSCRWCGAGAPTGRARWR